MDPEHPFGTAIGGSLVPYISRSSWLYVEPVYRGIFSAYLDTSPLGAPPPPVVAGAEEPALATQITARLKLRGDPPSYSGLYAAVMNAPVDALAELRAGGAAALVPPPRPRPRARRPRPRTTGPALRQAASHAPAPLTPRRRRTTP